MRSPAGVVFIVGPVTAVVVVVTRRANEARTNHERYNIRHALNRQLNGYITIGIIIAVILKTLLHESRLLHANGSSGIIVVIVIVICLY